MIHCCVSHRNLYFLYIIPTCTMIIKKGVYVQRLVCGKLRRGIVLFKKHQDDVKT